MAPPEFSLSFRNAPPPTPPTLNLRIPVFLANIVEIPSHNEEGAIEFSSNYKVKPNEVETTDGGELLKPGPVNLYIVDTILGRVTKQNLESPVLSAIRKLVLYSSKPRQP